MLRSLAWSAPAGRLLRRAVLACAAVALALPATSSADFTKPFNASAAHELMAASARWLPPGFTDTTVWSGLNFPTAIRWSPDGRVFVAQQNGVVQMFDNMSDPTPTTYVDLRQEVYQYADKGLLGMALDPQFTSGRPYLYVLYTYDKDPNSSVFPRWNDDCPSPPGADADGCVDSARLSRIDPDGTEHVLIQDWCGQFSTHTIGSLNFGADGALYASGGDGASYIFADYGQAGTPVNPCGDPPGGVGGSMTPPTAQGGALRSQSFRRAAGQPVTLDGAIIRVDPNTGDAMPDNPAAGDANANRRRIIAYGLRNPFRFTIRPGTSEVWTGDVGWNEWEEVNRVPDLSSVRNFGWPCYEGAAKMGSYDTLNLNSCETLYTAGTATSPYFTYNHGSTLNGDQGCPAGTSSQTGVAFYTGTQFPTEWRGALFMADYARKCLMVMQKGSNGLPDPATAQVFEAEAAGPVDLEMGPDGALYYVGLESGTIHRIAYPAGNHNPTASATATPDHGSTPLTVSFDGTGSSDPDGQGLSYTWDLNGDGTFGDATTATTSYTYTTPGNYTAQLRVTDPSNATDTFSIPITAGDAPTPTISSPSASFTWATGDTISYSGSAVDGQGNAIPASGLSWQLNIRHCSRIDLNNCHTHFGTVVNGVSSGTFIAPDHDYPSHLELVLTATDSHGLHASKTIALQPKTVDLTFTSSPAGAQMSAGADTGTGPFTFTFIQNSTTAITAATPQSIGGTPYAFSSWSDGGASTHEITVPTTNTTYTATFGPVTEFPLAGTDTVGTNVSQAATGHGEVYRMSGGTAGTATKLRLYIDSGSTASRLVLGLYADNNGNPGTLLGQAQTTTVTPGAWAEVTLPSAVPITAGTVYWLGLLNPSTGTGTLKWRDNAGASGGPEQTSPNSPLLSALPEGWLTGGSFTDGPVSGNAFGAPAGPPPPPALAVSPSSLTFSAVSGGSNPATKTVTVSNAGGGTLNYTASDNAAWLSVTPASGSAPKDLTVSVNTSGLAAGTYNANITIDAGSASGSPKTVPVTLTVSPPTPPALAVSPSSLTFSAVAGGANPAAQTLAVSNTGGGTLSYTATDDAPWMSEAPTSGSAPANVSVSISIAGLAAGTYTGNVTIDGGGATGSPKTIPVTLTVSPTAPPGTTIAGTETVGTNVSSAPAGAAEAYQITASTTGTASKLRVYIDNSTTAGEVVLGVYADTGNAPTSLLSSGRLTGLTKNAWNEVTLASGVAMTTGTKYWFGILNPSTSGGTLAWRDRAGGSGGLERTSAGRTMTDLPAAWSTLGAYTDGPISGYAVSSGPPAPPALSVAPASLSFSGTAGGANPAAKTVTVTNSGGGTLNFTTSDDSPWLSASPGSGTAPRDVTVSVDISGLAAGTYTGNVTIDGGGASGSPKTIPVTVTLAPPAPPALSVSPSSLSFTASQGGAAPPSQPISIANTGSGTLSYTTSSNAAWLSASPASGTAPASVNVSVNPAGLTPNTYTGTITVSASGASGSPKTVAVTLVVSAPVTGLVGAWGFDEAAGTTTADASGNNNIGTINGASRITTGKFGSALNFNGSSNWVTVNDSASLHLTTGMTVEGWVYPTANGSGGATWRAMAVKETATGLAWALYPFGDAGFPSGHAFTASEQWARGTSVLALNAWSHVAVTYDGTTVRFFVNGTQVGTKAQTGSLVTSSQPLRFGGDAVWPEWFKGRLDEIRIYNRALTAAQIQSDMAAPVSSATLLATQAKLRKSIAKKGTKARRTAGVKHVRFRGRHPHGWRPAKHRGHARS
jgi:glucose/arabinose dehydrogenase